MARRPWGNRGLPRRGGVGFGYHGRGGRADRRGVLVQSRNLYPCAIFVSQAREAGKGEAHPQNVYRPSGFRGGGFLCGGGGGAGGLFPPPPPPPPAGGGPP